MDRYRQRHDGRDPGSVPRQPCCSARHRRGLPRVLSRPCCGTGRRNRPCSHQRTGRPHLRAASRAQQRHAEAAIAAERAWQIARLRPLGEQTIGPSRIYRKEGKSKEKTISRTLQSALGRPGSDLLSHALRRSTIGAEEFNGRVRNGIGFGLLARTTRPAKRRLNG